MRATLVVVVILAGIAQEAASQSDRGRFLRWAYEDAGALTVDIAVNTPLLATSSTLVLVSISRLDDSTLREVQENYRGPVASYLRFANRFGGTSAAPVAAGIFTASLITDNARLQDAAFTSLQSVLFAGAMTTALKYAFGRFRPEERDGPFRFDSFSGNTSFPSGHATTAFALITPWVLYYPGTGTYALFGLSTGTAIARIALDKHWPSDVIGGAAIGFLTARYLSRRHQRTGGIASGIQISPAVTQFGTGLRLVLRVS